VRKSGGGCRVRKEFLVEPLFQSCVAGGSRPVMLVLALVSEIAGTYRRVIVVVNDHT